MRREKCVITENKEIAPHHYVMRLSSPRIAKNAKPGQFVQILCADSFDPLLGRPFSFLTADSQTISILYQVVGKGTKILSSLKKGEALWVLGPLGNGFAAGKREEVRGKRKILVGGGVGIPPLYHLAQKFKSEKETAVHIFLGAKNKKLLLCEKEFKKLGVKLHLATDDGSKGHKGFVTELLDDFLVDSSQKSVVRAKQLKDFLPDTCLLSTDYSIYACGPTPMLKAVSMIAQKYEIPCEVSVEVPMACGFGACLGCAVKTGDSRQKTGVRYSIACTEGPVFEAKDIVWD
ncbi:MAG: dihydroorotate dehydrogenase electron transfer subunit [Candidatus Omnitrophica bacterium]|nr:dihydroorotate dehydrogenase electron transfer subunit [Candidatus Omnitrophota bacterium]